MIKTGDWTISDLVKYLVAVQQTLSPMEMDRLRQTSAFPKELSIWDDGNENQGKRFKANQLYEPLETFREMKLPTIDWGSQARWRSTSEEGRTLSNHYQDKISLPLLSQVPIFVRTEKTTTS